ncbi:hypothetical protein P280DRAFT_195141 [Massarina eburnea CBS 473.64]|uniref:Ras guanyl-nucleotide exchange factor RasGEF n=1 Tax=Massarina eburnea CBS 473.64 TaxID=1395130 RepID=A0A6A6RLS0_9PLEO|nr:hypothetical protein P280DRAFT_195141 [Massarina eburnea CBS 473.64]
MSSPQIRSLYRRLLRELPVPPSTSSSTSTTTTAAAPSPHRSTSHQKLSAPTPLQQRIRNTLATTKAKSANQVQLGEQFVQYVQAQRMYASLVERYNPGMGMSEEERVRLTARRVGMDLPPEYTR